MLLSLLIILIPRRHFSLYMPTSTTNRSILFIQSKFQSNKNHFNLDTIIRFNWIWVVSTQNLPLISQNIYQTKNTCSRLFILLSSLIRLHNLYVYIVGRRCKMRFVLCGWGWVNTVKILNRLLSILFLSVFVYIYEKWYWFSL